MDEVAKDWICSNCYTTNYPNRWRCRRCDIQRDNWYQLDFDIKKNDSNLINNENPMWKIELTSMQHKLRLRFKSKSLLEAIHWIVDLKKDERMKVNEIEMSFRKSNKAKFEPKKIDDIKYEPAFPSLLKVMNECSFEILDKKKLRWSPQIRICFKGNEVDKESLEKFDKRSERTVEKVNLRNERTTFLGCECQGSLNKSFLDKSCLSKTEWIDQSTWNSMSKYEKIILRFNFSCTHLNLDSKTWMELSRDQKIDFSNRRKRWIRVNKRNFNEKDKKDLKFWKNRYRFKGKIYRIKVINKLMDNELAKNKEGDKRSLSKYENNSENRNIDEMSSFFDGNARGLNGLKNFDKSELAYNNSVQVNVNKTLLLERKFDNEVNDSASLTKNK